ncbi:MAG: F0F1 ATP synthase subunit A [Brumimicrobium sp.]|nr:F0F1 ATP synthase subunit A [Brumimicrobium sp.]
MMSNKTLKAFIWSLILFISAPAFSSSAEEGEPVNVNEMIMHHIKDAHEWHIMGPDHGEGAVVIPLPIILIDGGLKVFMSSKLYHGEIKTFQNKEGKEDHYIVNPELGYGIVHEKIYKLNAAGDLDFEHGHPTNAKPLDFSITKNVFALIFSAILLFLLLKASASTYKKNGLSAPKGITRFIEPIVVFVRDDIARANIGEKKYKKYMPFLLTAFFFIWINNMIGLIPIFPGGANLTGNISFTLVLASLTLILTLISGNKHYWQHIFATPGVPKALLPIMIPVEVIGIFTKPFALMIRLFANITAGHIIILSLIGIIFTFQNSAWGFLSVPMALFISVLELLVAFLQAFIFTMLSALFIGTAVAEEEHHY